MRVPRAALLALLPLAATAGCGDSGSSDSNGSKDSNNLESKSPQQVLDASVAALSRVKSFHLEGKEGSGAKLTTATADVGLPSKLRLALDQRGAKASIILVDGSLYVRANAAFWKQEHAGKAAAALAGRWLKTPASTGDLKDLTQDLDPKILSHCLANEHGTLASGGKATVDGQEAIVLIDKGDRPGTGPGKLYVAATGDPLPLRAIATGRERPGGKKDPKCDEEGDTPTEPGDEFKFSNYNEPLDISAPPSAVDLGGGQAS